MRLRGEFDFTSRQARRAMGTTFDFRVRHEPKDLAEVDALLSSMHACVRELEDELTEFKPGSPVARLNASKPGEWVEFTQSGFSLLELSLRISVLTGGAFDPTAKSAGAGLDRKPWQRIEIDPAGRRARKTAGDVRLGFGAIGKGYAIDRLSDLLEESGYGDYLLSAGGSSLSLSGYASAAGKPWVFGWAWERDADSDLLGVEFSHETGQPIAIGVSGVMEQGAHLIDTREPGSSRVEPLSSVLFAHSSATLADALSTAIFVGGWDAIREVPALHEEPPAIAQVDRGFVPKWNAVFQSLWKLPKDWLTVASMIAFALLVQPAFAQEEAIDLSTLGADSFNPYIFDRNFAWFALPAAMLLYALVHIRKHRFKNKGGLQAPASWQQAQGEQGEKDETRPQPDPQS